MRDGAELLARFGDGRVPRATIRSAGSWPATTYEQCWDEQRGMLHDYIGSPTFSQHANIMGILTDAIPAEQQQEVFNRIDSDTTISQATFYYRFYLTRALKKTGWADRYSSMLQPWYDMIDMGLSTFAENPEPTRSDCPRHGAPAPITTSSRRSSASNPTPPVSPASGSSRTRGT